MTIRPGLLRIARFAYGRRAGVALILAVTVGLLVRESVRGRYTPLASDSTHYVLLTRGLASGEGFVSGGSQHPDLSRSPLLPIVAAAYARATGEDALDAGRFVVALSSALLVVPLFLLSRRLFGPFAALAALPLGMFSCLIGTAIHVMPAAPYLALALGAIALAASAGAGRSRSGTVAVPRAAWLGAGALAGAASLARTEGLIVALALVLWAAIGPLVRPRPRARRPGEGMAASEKGRLGSQHGGADGSSGAAERRTEHPRKAPARGATFMGGLAARAGLVVAGVLLVYGPYAVWVSARLGRVAPVPGMQYLSDMREVCDRLSLRDMDGPDLPWSERATYVVSADHSKRVLETWFNSRVLLEPEATFVDAAQRGASDESPAGPMRAEASVSPAPPTPEAPTLRNELVRRLRIVFESLRGLPSALKEGHYLPIVPVGLGMIGLATGLASRARRRAFLLLAVMAPATLAPLLSHVEGRFLYAPFALGLVAAAAGWGWIAARLAALGGGAAGIALRAGIHLALAAGVLAAGVRHTDGLVEPLARQAVHREIGPEVARAAGGGPVLAVQSYAPFWAGRPYRAIPIGGPSVVMDYARAQDATCLVLEGNADLARRPELAPLMQDPPPPGYGLVLRRPAVQGGELRVFRLEDGDGAFGARDAQDLGARTGSGGGAPGSDRAPATAPNGPTDGAAEAHD